VLAERHIDLLDMRSLFDGRPVVSYAAPRHDEERWKTVGFVNALASSSSGRCAATRSD
jgi:hypothetical protein